MKLILMALAIALLSTSCTHQFMRLIVPMKTDKHTAHVSLGNNDVKVGDKLDFYTNQCTGADR